MTDIHSQVPANAIGMTTYETLKRYGAEWQQKRQEKRDEVDASA